MRIIAEIGSTHNGKLSECLNAIRTASEIGIKDVKFQLLENKHLGYGNIPFERFWIEEVMECGRNNNVNVFFSCWSSDTIRLCKSNGCQSVKIAYSANMVKPLIGYAIDSFKEVFVSCDIMTTELPDKCTKLYCIPEYPVKYLVDFNGLFPRFDGFSDHTLGTSQTAEAVKHGAKIIEKHVCQCPDSPCPDAKFAISWNEMEKLVKEAEKIK